MGGFVATERINKALESSLPFAQFNQFRIEHTGTIREIILWCQGLDGSSEVLYGFLVNGIEQFITSSDWFNPILNNTAYTKTGLNIPVTKGQKANFHQIGGRRPNSVLPIFVFETELP